MPAKKNPSTSNCSSSSCDTSIHIAGARQHNLKNLTLDIPLGKMTVITGPSGSGKSSLAFHTLYAEGQRRYVETFSPYVRQFLDRMDKPAVDRIDNIPPAIAIEQKNTIRSTRSTVGTLTEINDYLKVLFPHIARAFDPETGEEIKPFSAEDIANWSYAHLLEESALILFPVNIPDSSSIDDILPILTQQGFTRIFHNRDVLRIDSPDCADLWKNSPVHTLYLVQDRIKITPKNRRRLLEAIESALTFGKGHLRIVSNSKDQGFSSLWHNPGTGFTLRPPTASLFSFNSPLGACQRCRGFGRTIGIDLQKAVSKPYLSLSDGCVTAFFTPRGMECQHDLIRTASYRDIDLDTPFEKLTAADREWVLYGDAGKNGTAQDTQDAWDKSQWYGVKGFFDWLETKAYKMSVRVFLSRYRSYTECPDCHGTRLQPEAHCFKIYGKTLPDLWQMPIHELRDWFSSHFASTSDQSPSLQHALNEVTSRLHYLCKVGLSYLTLDRPANTLSGGEIERVNLTTCLGAALTNTLFVLDEPTVGLHQRDIRQLIGVMHDLRDKGNTVVVVEHEASVMHACDHLIDLGPAAGEHGGNIVFQGALNNLKKTTFNPQKSTTIPYLTGEKHLPVPANRRPINPKKLLTITGGCKHNISNLSFTLPLGIFTCLTGVSGSGKSTLAYDILYLNLAKRLSISIDKSPAPLKKFHGYQHLSDVELVDQTPLTRTPRSTPAVHSGAFEAIRKLYALSPQAIVNELTPGYFSFNSGAGRCQRCMGNGAEKVEMQFLSDLFITCPECRGSRYTKKALTYLYDGRHIAEILTLTIKETSAWASSSQHKNKPQKERTLLNKIYTTLQPLIDVGLGYLRLGQPLNTLSGGESQRLKLCKILSSAQGSPKKNSSSLLILDEPTTGLHFSDIDKLLKVFHRLTAVGHSLLVIEHNLDVIRSADYLIEMGPHAGTKGGQIVFTGTPDEILSTSTETAKALISPTPQLLPPPTSQLQHSTISIRGAREHNLKNISLDIPRDEFVVVTGLSGSGKSTLAFDIIFAEGQRRFLDSMSPYARQFAGQLEKPDIDRITGLPPTVAIEQRVSRGGGKSTVGTVTEIYHFLRLLYAKLGIQHCPESGEPVISQTINAIEQQINSLLKKHPKLLILAPLIRARKGYHTDVAKLAAKQGISQLLVDGRLLLTQDFQALERFQVHDIFAVCSSVSDAIQRGQGTCAVQLPDHQKSLITFSTQYVSPVTGQSFDPLDPHHFSFNSHRGWCSTCRGYGYLPSEPAKKTTRQKKDNHPYNSTLEAEIHENLQLSGTRHRHTVQSLCPDCHGARLRKESRHVFINKTPIQEINALSVVDAITRLQRWKFTGREKLIARDILPEIIQRLQFLQHVGLSYLQLDRSADTLSGGESQRIRLAAQLGSNLRGVLYVLDEPTIGLHPRDNVNLLNTLEALRQRGNSLLVVEHDDATIARATHLIELGPGAGVLGGELMPPDSASSNDTSKKNPYPRRKIPKVSEKSAWLTLTQCHANNLKNINVRIPLARLTVLTGVSGCGKSSLMRGCLSKAANASPKRNNTSPPYHSAAGFGKIKHCFEVDQSPIGKTSRSCPATYVKLLDSIRRLFAQLPDARARGFSPSRFSFNNAEGQCPECKGNGRIKLEMEFLPTTWIPCDTCREMRYNPSTLDIRYNGKNIGEVLRMNIREAATFFSAVPKLHKTLQLLSDTGLDYLQLGQPSPTLSGGEAQRIKLVSELTKGRKSIGKAIQTINNLYLIEEPSIGLHQQDVEKLIDVLHRLVEEGHTVVVIEHNTAVMAEADYLIDLGPEAGERGGKIVAQGTPEHVACSPLSRTAPFLKKQLIS